MNRSKETAGKDKDGSTQAGAGITAPFWERAVAMLGLLLVLASLGFLLYEGLWGDHSPPDVVVAPEEILVSGEDYLVKFAAWNEGGETAAGVKITGTLTRDGAQVEQAETTVDFVPPGSRQQGGLYFDHDPRQGELELDVAGYQRP